MGESGDVTEIRAGDGEGVTTLLLGTTREWFASALEAVLHSVGFTVVKAGGVDELLARTEEIRPDLVVVDESLPGVEIPVLCGRLVDGPLPTDVPLVIYAETFSREGLHAEALDAGAWEILNEPIRARVLVSALQRLLELSRRMAAEPTNGPPLWDEETGLFTESGLERVLPSLQALASRNDLRMSCVVLGPTQLGRGQVLERQRHATADLCAVNVRASDVCGWLGEGELAIIAFGTPAEGAAKLAERLNQVAAGRAEVSAESRTLSAGIVELLTGDRGAEERRREDVSERRRAARIRHLEAARDALRRAREGGGGIRVAEGV